MSRRWSISLWQCMGGVAVVAALAMVCAPAVAKKPERDSAAAGKPRAAKAVAERRSARAHPPVSRAVRSAKGRTASPSGRSRKASATTSRRGRGRAVAVPSVPSVGMLAGLHRVDDPLDLKSSVALVIDPSSNEVLLSKNPDAVLPIASITKLMTALIVVESGLPLEERLAIDEDDAEQTSRSRSRLVPGTTMTRAEMLRLALMASENRAAHALSRHYPGGSDAFVAEMNRKAQQLGMTDTRFVEATGLSPDNRASATDLTRLVAAAASHELIREYSTAKESVVPVGMRDREVHFRSTNGLIGSPKWDISLQKTGYIAAAGRCLVMQASLAGRELTMVLLDSAGKYSRFADAERIRKWLLDQAPSVPGSGMLSGSKLNTGR